MNIEIWTEAAQFPFQYLLQFCAGEAIFAAQQRIAIT
jgi:hypothetical protein